MINKSLARPDIKSSYTNVPVSKCIEHLENYIKKTKITLPDNKIIHICTLYTNDCFFFSVYWYLL